MAQRSFGWIQDSGSLRNLKNILKAMDRSNPFHDYMKNKLIPKYVPDRFGRTELANALNNDDIPYMLLRGRGVGCQLTKDENMKLFGYSDKEATAIVRKGGRGNAACTGIAQLCLEAQKTLPNGEKKPYQGEWQAECFVRMGISLGLIDYDIAKDTCRLSAEGKVFADSEEDSAEELASKETALLKYPPACRILELLEAEGHLTKFEIGSRLGFVGEAGFTSIPQEMVVYGYYEEHNEAERRKILADTEGTSDKYARMIAGWLIEVGWVKKLPKEVTETYAGVTNTLKINASYIITLKGKQAVKRIQGSSSLAGVPKIVFREMLATKGGDGDREYLRDRRALILDALRTDKTLEAVKVYLDSKGINEDTEAILDDIESFKCIGLHIRQNGDKFKLTDTITNLFVPRRSQAVKSDALVVKDSIRRKLLHINHKYLVLLDLAYDSQANRDFEIETMSLLTKELDYEGTHLGGASKPDGVFFKDKDGVIVDTKAYSGGYSLPLSQADEMIRYIDENKARGTINPNEWWKNFDSGVSLFSYLFVSSEFKGGYQDRIDYIKRRTDTDGAIITAENLLLFAESVKSGSVSYKDSFGLLRCNKQYEQA